MGVTPILHYDQLGRLVRTDLPNGTFSLVAFDPWMETRWDPNDTVADSLWYASRAGLESDDPERLAADKAYAHRDTPSVVHLDALGRPFLTIEDNGGTDQFATTVELDIEGNALSITDHRGVVVQESAFAMGGRKLYQKSCDAGERWMLGDVGGALLRAWDQRGFTRRAEYDEGRRPTHLWVKPDGADEMLVERTVYGEDLGTSAAASNLRGKPYLHFDGAGVVKSVSFDFKGNLLQSERRLATEYQSQVDWLALATTATIAEAENADLLESETFTAQTAYDALNRPTSLTTPDSSEIKPIYNEAGLLERVEVRVRGAAGWTVFVNNIDYDAKGQREKIVYAEDASGNGRVTTEYIYDPLTFRMTQLKTRRASDNALLQNLAYTYDPVGNITEIRDNALQTVFFGGEVILPKMAYVYDALYRLTEATGREQAGTSADVQRDQNGIPILNLPDPNDTNAVRNYTEDYVYDAVGNLLSMSHDGGTSATWTRYYDYEVDANSNPVSNRLMGTSVPGDSQGEYSAQYTYDEHGNMLSMPHLPTITWNYRDEMVSADKGSGSGTVYFTYDSAGQRVRKVYEHSGLIEERIYLGGFEIYRRTVESTGEVTLERETLHVMDGVRRIALVETKTEDTSLSGFTPVTVVRVQLGNHLGSAALEVTLDGEVISYEEYHPYGTTAYQSASSAVEVSRKRYRYTGKERDEETGLYYHGARYYAPWLGRWTAADPAGLAGGANVFAYGADNPVGFNDPTGLAPDLSTLEKIDGRWVAFDPDEGHHVYVQVTDSTTDAPRVGLPKPSAEGDSQKRAAAQTQHERQEMWAVAGTQPIAAPIIVGGAFVSWVFEKLGVGIEQDPRKAAALGEAVALAADALGAVGAARAAGQDGAPVVPPNPNKKVKAPAPAKPAPEPTPASVRPPQPEKPPTATVNGKEVPATRYDVLHHGTTESDLRVTLEEVLKNGLPPRGTNRDLENHVKGGKDSAFRGGTILPATPDGQGGAVQWAGEGGIVFKLRRVWGWDANKELAGRVRTPAGFTGNPASGEHEISLLSEQPGSNIEGYYIPSSDRAGRLIPGRFFPNPHYKKE